MTQPIDQSYPWYVNDWLGSSTRAVMSAEQRGIYRDLLDVCWREGSLPSDDGTLQRIAAVTDKEWRRSWPGVKDKFELRDGRLWNAKVDAKRPKVAQAKANRSASATKAAEARWSNASAMRNASSTQTAGNASECGTPSPSPSPSPCSLTLTERVSAVVDNSPPPWKIDEVFVEFQEKYNSTGGAFIDEDYTEAFRLWRRLQPDQRIERLNSLAKHLEEYRLEPRFAPRPLKFLESEWKRPVKPSPAGTVEYDYGR